MRFQLWILVFGFWNLGFGFWDLDFSILFHAKSSETKSYMGLYVLTAKQEGLYFGENLLALFAPQ
jgi:hypothetical protein